MSQIQSESKDTERQEILAEQNRMGKDPIVPLLAKMSLPAMFSMLIQACYNIVDSIFVSRLGEDALSAVSLIYPIQMLSVAVAVGTGVGLSSLISRKLGEGNQKAADMAASHGIFLAIISWIVFSLFGLFGTTPFVNAFSDKPSLIAPAVSYCTIVCVCSLFPFSTVNCEKIMQGTGSMIAPMFCALTGAITNIILDPILIFGYFGFPALGVTGAAVATVIGQFMGMLVTFVFLFSKPLPVKVKLKGFKPDILTIKSIYQVGLPSMLMQAIASVLNIAMNAILISFSETAVAVLGVYFKVQSFVFMPVFGMNQGLMPLLGYNFGARNKERLIQAFKTGMIIAMVIMVGGTVLFHIFPQQIMLLFKAEGAMMTIGVMALKTISLCFPAAAFCIIASTLFQATAHGNYSLIVSILRQLGFILPLAYIFSRIWGLDGIWYAYPAAETMSILASSIFLKKLWREDISRM